MFHSHISNTYSIIKHRKDLERRVLGGGGGRGCDGVSNSIIFGSVELERENWAGEATRHRTKPSRVVGGEEIVMGARPMPDTSRFTHSHFWLTHTHTHRKVMKTYYQFLKLT